MKEKVGKARRSDFDFLQCPWEDLPKSIKDMYDRAAWHDLVSEVKATIRAERKPHKPPADWVEPSMTLAQAEADSEWASLAAMMRENGIERITRTEYLSYNCWGSVGSWDAEAESMMPAPLQDWEYMWINPSLRRKGADDDEVEG